MQYGCARPEDSDHGAHFVVVASCLPLSGVDWRGCFAQRDKALGQTVEASSEPMLRMGGWPLLRPSHLRCEVEGTASAISTTSAHEVLESGDCLVNV